MLIRKSVSMLISYCCGSVHGSTSVRVAATAEPGWIRAANEPVWSLWPPTTTAQKTEGTEKFYFPCVIIIIFCRLESEKLTKCLMNSVD